MIYLDITKPGLEFVRYMVGIMSSAWSTLANIKIDGVPFTALILAICIICILLGAIFGGKTSV